MTKKVMLVWGLLLALLIVEPRPVDAQARIGLNWGVTFATLEGDDANGPFLRTADLGNETGFFAGASLGLPLDGILSITPGLYFVQKGTSWERGIFEGSVELSYIEVPVTIGVAVTSTDRPFGVSLFAGPEIAFEIDCNVEVGTSTGAEVDTSIGQFEDCRGEGEESDRKSIDFGLVFGANVSFGPFFVNGGLDMGLTSLDDSDADEDFKNSAWFLGAGILIGG
jgi:hypothetical protein